MRAILNVPVEIRQHANIFRAIEREPYAPVRDHAADITKALPGTLPQIPRRPWFSCYCAVAGQIQPRFRWCHRRRGVGNQKCFLRFVRTAPAVYFFFKAQLPRAPFYEIAHKITDASRHQKSERHHQKSECRLPMVRNGTAQVQDESRPEVA